MTNLSVNFNKKYCCILKCFNKICCFVKCKNNNNHEYDETMISIDNEWREILENNYNFIELVKYESDSDDTSSYNSC